MADKAVQLNKKAEKTEKPVKPLVRAHARSLRIAPRKMRLVTNLVKDMRLNDAVTQLQFTNKKGAKMLQKLLQSAAANAEHNFSLNRDGLFIKTITCDMGPVLQRSFPRARGSAFMIRRKMSHVNVILEERDIKVKKKKAVVPKAVKPESKPHKEEKTTVEGTASLPDETEVDTIETPAIVEADVQEIHNENTGDLVDEKTSPQNLRK